MKSTIKNLPVSIQGMRTAVALGFASVALLLAIPAQASSLVTNGSFEENTGNCSVSTSGCATGWGSTGYTFLYTSAASAQNPGYAGVKLWGPLSGSANGLGASPDGGAFLAMDGDYESGPVTQTISGLIVGQEYQVSFWYAASQQTGFDGPTVQAMNVCLGTSGESYFNTGTQPLSGGTNASTNINCAGSGASTALINLPDKGFSGWEYYNVDLTANSTSDVLSFLAYGNLQVPPFALLDGVSMTPIPEPATLPLLFTGLMGGLAVLRSKKWRKS
jgi:hypothetical protein